MKTPSIELSIIMPCLNEAETIATCISKAKQFLTKNEISGEIVIGDNGSTDGSQNIATELGARVIDVPVRGYGAALFFACHAAQGKYLIMADSDDSYDFLELSEFVDKLRAGYDLVMGNRFKGKIMPGAMPWKNRYIGNPALSFIGRLLFNCPIRDFHCGLRGLSKTAFHTLDLRTTGMEFASEMVVKATLLNLKITEVPTVLHPDGRTRSPHLRPWRDGWRHLRFLLLFSPRWLFLYPGLFLFILGAFLVCRLAIGPIELNGIVLDVHTLIFATTFVLAGFQAMVFAIGTKIFAATKGYLPRDYRFTSLTSFVSLEVGVGLGILLGLAGLAGSFYALWFWSIHGFGDLNTSIVLRIVVPSMLACLLGLQIILASFFLSVLQIDQTVLVLKTPDSDKQSLNHED